ncbi:MAG TPA: c-type cytochrome domain-containing protein, partial [Pirellulales bacterium]|nr:c-type cytochrome domain-containing protein [Pirellulales bacterium]
MLIRLFRAISPLIAVSIVAHAAASAAPVDFQRDVQPLFAEHCAECHGVDAANRKSGLRLDVREDALKGGDSGAAAIVPTKPDESELIRRITSTDPESIMPPPSHNKPLSAKDIEVLRQWVADGAQYASHWAFTPPVKASVPNVGAPHPIDA